MDFRSDDEDIFRFVEHGKYKRAALQIPDDMLNFGPDLVLRLKNRMPSCDWFILGDTSYGSCCVDVVAAEHVKADCMIHFGQCCLSIPSSLPVLLVFPNRELPELPKSIEGENLTLIYDVSLHHRVPELRSYCEEHGMALAEVPTQFVKGRKMGGRMFMGRVIPESSKGILYVTPYPNDDMAILIALEFYDEDDKELYFCSPGSPLSNLRDLVSSGFFTKRRMMIERGKKEKAIGVLCGTASAEGIAEQLRDVVRCVKLSKKTPYTLVVGKINQEKLLNFSNLTVFILLGCPINTMEVSKRFSNVMCNIITPQEFLFCYFKEWMPKYSVSSKIDIDTELETKGAEDEQNSAIVQMSGTDLVMKESPAALFMHSNNRWLGVDPSVENIAVSAPEVGRSGIASGYEEERNLPKPTPYVKRERKKREEIEAKSDVDKVDKNEEEEEEIIMEGLKELF